MKTTEYLDALSVRYAKDGKPLSDYALAKILPVRQQTISRYRKGAGFFDDKVCKTVAELLDLDPAQVIADVHAERTDDKEMKAIWKRIADSFGRAACLILLTFPAVDLPFPNDVQAAEKQHYIYYVK